MTEFKRGDVVYQISNKKQKMVVIGLWENSTEPVECRWITEKGKCKEHTFYVKELKKVKDDLQHRS